MRRKYPESPIVGVAAVIFVEQAILLVRRNQEPAKGEWSLPGGAVELGETLVEALKREIWEEVSITIQIGGLLGVFDRIYRDPQTRVKYHYVLVDYWAWMVSGCPRHATDISAIRQVPIEEVHALEIDVELKKTIFEAIRIRKLTSPAATGLGTWPK